MNRRTGNAKPAIVTSTVDVTVVLPFAGVGDNIGASSPRPGDEGTTATTISVSKLA